MSTRFAIAVLLGILPLGLVACQRIEIGPPGGFETMAALPGEGRIVSVTRGDGFFHGVWVESADGSLSVVWVNTATGQILANPQKFARK